MLLKAEELYVFGPYQLDARERQLLRNGETVSLPPKAFDLLVALVARAAHLVTKEELLAEVRAGTFVEDANISWRLESIEQQRNCRATHAVVLQQYVAEPEDQKRDTFIHRPAPCG